MFSRKKKSLRLPTVRRLAGQSLRDERERLLENRFIPLYFATVFAWITWLLEWTRLRQHIAPQPKLWLMAAIIGTGVCAVVVRRLINHFQRLNQGELGERKVAEALENLSSSGYRVFHDLRRDRFNVDHVVVGASGVYAIETKFRSGYGTINFRNGEGLFVNDQPWQGDRDPVAQARGSAAEIHKLIKDNCEVNVTVTALVVFVGEWKVQEKWQTTDARVVSESQLLRYFARQDQPELTRNEIRLIASHLERSAKA
jgi:hypothetical protein